VGGDEGEYFENNGDAAILFGMFANGLAGLDWWVATREEEDFRLASHGLGLRAIVLSSNCTFEQLCFRAVVLSSEWACEP
jgi:hypothetical protein